MDNIDTDEINDECEACLTTIDMIYDAEERSIIDFSNQIKKALDIKMSKIFENLEDSQKKFKFMTLFNRTLNLVFGDLWEKNKSKFENLDNAFFENLANQYKTQIQILKPEYFFETKNIVNSRKMALLILYCPDIKNIECDGLTPELCDIHLKSSEYFYSKTKPLESIIEDLKEFKVLLIKHPEYKNFNGVEIKLEYIDTIIKYISK